MGRRRSFILSINGVNFFFFLSFFFFSAGFLYSKFLLTEYFNVYSPLSRNLLPRVRIVEPGATTSMVDIVHRQIDNQSVSPPEAIAAGQQIRKIMEKRKEKRERK